MKSITRIVVVCLTLLALQLIVPLPGVSRSVELQVGQSTFEPAGTLRNDGTTMGTSIDVEETLGLDSDDALGASVHLRTGDFQYVRINYASVDFNQSGTLDTSITFDDRVFNNGETIEADLKYKLMAVDLEFRLNGPTGPDYFNFVIGGRGVEYKGTLKTKSGTKKAEAGFESATPVAGVNLRKHLDPRFFLGVRWQGMDASYKDYEIQYLDGEINLGIMLFKDVWLTSSYHDLRMDGVNEDDVFDLKFTGPKANVLIYF